MDIATFAIQCLNALQYGLLLFLVASGLTLIFGIMGVINLAHGSFYMLGAYMAFALAPLVAGTLGGGFFTTLLVGVVLAVILGYVLEWAFFSFLYTREHLQQVLMTYGLILVFEEVRSLLVGDDVHGVSAPAILSGTLPLGDVMTYPVYRLFMSGVCLLLAQRLSLCNRICDRDQRQREVEGRAGAQLALGPQAATMGQHDVFDDGQAQARAARLAGAGLVHAVEALEYPVQMLRGNAGPEVLHRELNLRLQQPRADANPLPCPAVLEGVLDQIAEDLIHGVGVGHHQNCGRARGFQFDAGIDHQAPQRLDSVLDQGAGAVRLKNQLVIRALHAGKSEQILGEAVHARRVLEDDPKELAGRLRVGTRIFYQRLDVALNGGQRGTQFVADVGDEIAAGFFCRLNAGDVMQYHQSPAAGQRRAGLDAVL